MNSTKHDLALAAIIAALLGIIAAVGGFADDGHNESPMPFGGESTMDRSRSIKSATF